MFATKLESDERAKGVAMLQRALDEQRDLTLRLTTEQASISVRNLNLNNPDFIALIY